MPALESIFRLLERLETDERSMPSTILYNEGWMLRLVLDAGGKGHLPSVLPSGTPWYSEAQLRTPFGRERGPKHEANTHADGVVGDFTDIADTKSGLEVHAESKRFLILEAKMYSALSASTKNAPGYDQAARNVACIAETLRRAGCRPESMSAIGFYVIAPKSQIDSGLFEGPMSAQSIRLRVAERIQQFNGIARDQLTEWQDQWFLPLVSQMEKSGTLRCLSWEDLIQEISDSDAVTGSEINDFYQKCKQYNLSVSRTSERTGRPTRGMVYLLTAGKHKGQRVRVASAGSSNSRVYQEGSRDDSFLAPNSHLEIVPAPEQTPPPADPIAGREYDWIGASEGSVRVRVKNVGDCNSRVVQVGSEARSFKVPNHQLCDPEP